MVALMNSTNSGSKDDSFITKSTFHPAASGAQNPNKRTRRLWSVQGEPHSILKRLRSQLAEDGCAESQLLLAKTLLSFDDDTNYEENCQQAIYWLTHASLQGNTEATQMLEECFAKGKGIYEQNYEDVKNCLKMDQQEKLARVAASHLFLSLSNGNEWITLKMLQKYFHEVCAQQGGHSPFKDQHSKQPTSKEILNLLELKYGGERLSEADIIKASQDYASGSLPQSSIDYDACFSISRPFRPFSAAYTKVIYHLYFIFCNIFLYKLSYYHWLIPAVFSILIVNYLNLNELIVFLVYFLWAGSFLAMSYSIVALLMYHKEKRFFNLWSCVLKQHCKDLDTKLAHKKFRKQYIPLYVSYFGGLFIYLCTLPFIHPSMISIAFPPLALLSFPLFFALLESNAIFNTVSSSLYVLSHKPFTLQSIKQSLIKALPLTTVFLNEREYSFFDIFYVNLDLGSIFHWLWLVSLLFVGFSLGFKNIVGQVVNVTWFHTVLISYSHITFQFYFFAALIWVFILSLPYSFNVLKESFLGVLMCLACISYNGDFKLAFFISFFVSVLLYACSVISSRTSALLKLFAIISSCIFLVHKHNEFRDSSVQFSRRLKWDSFQNACVPSKDSVIAQLEHDCRPLRGLSVEWEGTVKQVQVESVSNWVESCFSFFPYALQNQLTCLVGHKKSSCSSKNDQLCQIIAAAKHQQCSLDNWDVYRFRVTVLMYSTFWKFGKETEIFLEADNDFTETILQLSINDRISFVGFLTEGIGTSTPRVHLSSLTCKLCQNGPVSFYYQPLEINYEAFSQSLKSAFNFFFGPSIRLSF